MNFKFTYFVFVVLIFFCLYTRKIDGKKHGRRSLGNVTDVSNSTKEQVTTNATSVKYSKSKKLKHVGTTSKLRHMATRKVNSPGRGVKSHLPLTAKGQKEMKRQFILRPPSSQFSMFDQGQKPPFMMMRPPPLTQKTVVTTHIPRPPIAIPFNPLFMNHLMHSLHGGMHSPFAGLLGNGDIMKTYEEDDDDEG